MCIRCGDCSSTLPICLQRTCFFFVAVHDNGELFLRRRRNKHLPNRTKQHRTKQHQNVTTSNVTSSNITTVSISMEDRGHATQKSATQTTLARIPTTIQIVWVSFIPVALNVLTQHHNTYEHLWNKYMVTVPALARFSSESCLWACHCFPVFHLCLQRLSPKRKRERTTPSYTSGWWFRDCCSHEKNTREPFQLGFLRCLLPPAP